MKGGIKWELTDRHYYESESEVSQLCPAFGDPMDCSPPGSSVHGIFQARVLEWVATSFSRGSSQPRDQTQVSRIVDALPSEPLGKSSSGLHTLLYIKQINNKDLLNSPENYILYLIITYNGKESEKE